MVQWVTRDRGSPRARWGKRSVHAGSSSGGGGGGGSYEHNATGSSSTYTREEMCGAPANTTGGMQPGWLQAAVMSGLEPSTRYYYQYGDEVGAGCCPGLGDSSQPLGCMGGPA